MATTSTMQQTSKKKYICAIDAGTTSVRCILFDLYGNAVDMHQIEVSQIYTENEPGWTEQDPMVILRSVYECLENITMKNRDASIVAIGITNQRETTIVWDQETGKPLHNAIVWHDSRTSSLVKQFESQLKSPDHFRQKTGLPISTYFSAMKLHWILHKAEHELPEKRKSLSPHLQAALQRKTAAFGTVDSWLIWNLTGAAKRGLHVTDVSNASRTMLMNLHTLNWDKEICEELQIPAFLLPDIRASSEVYGHVAGSVEYYKNPHKHISLGSTASSMLNGIPISGCLGDQQAAMVGQLCFSLGAAKNTYGTGCFLLMNTGETPVPSKSGLLTTVCYKLAKDTPCIYALEGSIAVAGAAVRWLRDELHIIKHNDEINQFAAEVPNSNGVYFVPAFSGLLSPYWRPDARGILCGLTHSSSRSHIARAVLEASAFQSYDIITAMTADSAIPIKSLRVDGGLANSDILLQFQSDLLGIDVIRPKNLECTAAGAAYAAGLAVGFWADTIDLQEKVGRGGGTVYRPSMKDGDRNSKVNGWLKAVARSFDWATKDDETPPLRRQVNKKVDSKL